MKYSTAIIAQKVGENMGRKIINKLKEGLFAMFALGLIVSAIAYSEPEKLESVTHIFAQYAPIQYGIPDQIVGIWHGSQQDIYINDKQLVIHTGHQASEIHTPLVTHVQSEFDLENIEDTEKRILYTLEWENEIQPGQQKNSVLTETMNVVYDEEDNSLIMEDGRILN